MHRGCLVQPGNAPTIDRFPTNKEILMGLRAFYGDLSTPRVFAIDVNSMTRIVEEDIPLSAPAYPVDKISSHLLYAITRGENSITPIDIGTYSSQTPIALTHQPRSTATRTISKKTLCLVAGSDQPVTSIIDVASSTVIQSVGQPTSDTDVDFGGGLASGHPRWIDSNNFFLVDRRRREISVYALGQSLPLWSCRTPTSSHHISEYQGSYVALSEGNPASKIPPSLTFFNINKRYPQRSAVSQVLFLPSADGGAHHLGILDDTIYVPTSTGTVYVIRPAKKGFRFCKPIKAGKGAGHVFFNPKASTGVIVNHTDTFVTLFDQLKRTAITNVKVASPPVAGKKSQAHTSTIVANGKYFYGAASQDGEFYRIDLAKKIKDQTFDLDTYGAKATPLQGTFA